MSREDVRRRYELAGRALYAWVQDMPEVPTSLADSPAAASLRSARESARTVYRASRELWQSGMATEDLAVQTRAANQMAEAVRTVARFLGRIGAGSRGLRTGARAGEVGLTGRLLRAWRGWVTSSPVYRASQGVLSAAAALREVVPAAAAGFAAGGILALAALAGGLWLVFGRK